MNKNITSRQKIFALLCFFYTFNMGNAAIAAENKGVATLTFYGVVDMTESQSVTQSVMGTLSGTTSFTHSPIYADQKPGSGLIIWGPLYPLIGISDTTFQCGDANSTVLKAIPDAPGKYGIELLTSNAWPSGVYVVPELNFTVNLSNLGASNMKASYGGQLMRPPTDGLLSNDSNRNNCFRPREGTIPPIGGAKEINITSPSQYTLYVRKDIVPGVLGYKQNLYIVSNGVFANADAYLKLDIQSNLIVVRTCQISNVTNTQFNETFSYSYESLQQSQLTVTCSGNMRQPLYTTVRVKEGQVDPLEPSKLMLNQISGAESKAKPWILGMPMESNASYPLSCQDAGKNGLMRFDGVDTLVNGAYSAVNNPVTNLIIKWALCSSPEVKAGDYRGKVEVSFYLRN